MSVELSAAEKRIVRVLRGLRVGEVVAYGEVARRAGLPGRARLVARVLARSGLPDLPWHRVLRADGRIAFPERSNGYREQVRRLRAEGIEIVAGRARRAPAAEDLDALLWRPSRASRTGRL